MDDDLLLVREIYGQVIKKKVFYGNKSFSILDTRIKCILEDNRKFYLERASPEIVFFLRELNGKQTRDDRERFVDILMSIPGIIDSLSKYMRKIVIDNYDEKTGLYSASVEFCDGSIVIKRKMIPSHAIFLAKLAKKPVYVKKSLVDQQEEMYNLLVELESLNNDRDEYEEDEYI
ncbi:MAG: hypothetical protein QXX35_05565 [Desulfurococcaceae archaeon]|uniref:BFN domain-containing protein n=1 Tax=Staphylothermus marinus TaxID=2280 RepID=A0A7C4HD88_STAMA